MEKKTKHNQTKQNRNKNKKVDKRNVNRAKKLANKDEVKHQMREKTHTHK